MTDREAHKKASALGYESGAPAPQIIAQGSGREAERIVEIAREAGVVIVENEALASMLDAGCSVGDYVPPWCWEAVAGILAFVLAEERK